MFVVTVDDEIVAITTKEEDAMAFVHGYNVDKSTAKVEIKEITNETKELPKARNPFVQHLITKKSGAHGKSKKAQRRDDKVELRKGNKPQDDFDKG